MDCLWLLFFVALAAGAQVWLLASNSQLRKQAVEATAQTQNALKKLHNLQALNEALMTDWPALPAELTQTDPAHLRQAQQVLILARHQDELTFHHWSAGHNHTADLFPYVDWLIREVRRLQTPESTEQEVI